jgi:hypothetical protein
MRHLDHGVVSPPCDQPIHGTDPHPSRLHSSEWLESTFRHRYFSAHLKNMSGQEQHEADISCRWHSLTNLGVSANAEVRVRSARLPKTESWEIMQPLPLLGRIAPTCCFRKLVRSPQPDLMSGGVRMSRTECNKKEHRHCYHPRPFFI